MKKSLSWRTVLVPVATVTALVGAPLAGAGVAYATDHPYPPHATDHPYPPHPTDHPYPPKPHEPHEPGHGKPDHDNGHKPDAPHLAETGDDSTMDLALGGAGAALVVAGVGARLVARRRRTS